MRWGEHVSNREWERENAQELKPEHAGESDRKREVHDGQKQRDRKKERKNDTRKSRRQKKCAESYRLRDMVVRMHTKYLLCNLHIVVFWILTIVPKKINYYYLCFFIYLQRKRIGYHCVNCTGIFELEYYLSIQYSLYHL